MLKCKEVSSLLCSENPSRKKKLGIYLHLSICKHCRKFALQIKYLKLELIKLSQKYIDATPKDKIKQLEDEIIKTIQKN